MKPKVVWCVVALIGVLALSVTTAQAGGAGGLGAFSAYFACHGVNGGDLGQVVDIYTDEFGISPQSNVRIGSSVLVCTQVRLTTPGGTPGSSDELQPFSGSYLKCYTTSGSRKPGGPPAGTPTRYTATDNFDNDATTGGHVEEDLTVSELRYLCTSADFLGE